jgi:hypothetical protein
LKKPKEWLRTRSALAELGRSDQQSWLPRRKNGDVPCPAVSDQSSRSHARSIPENALQCRGDIADFFAILPQNFACPARFRPIQLHIENLPALYMRAGIIKI